MPEQARIAALFILIQQAKERSWRAHIAKKDAKALEAAREVSALAAELVGLLTA